MVTATYNIEETKALITQHKNVLESLIDREIKDPTYRWDLYWHGFDLLRVPQAFWTVIEVVEECGIEEPHWKFLKLLDLCGYNSEALSLYAEMIRSGVSYQNMDHILRMGASVEACREIWTTLRYDVELGVNCLSRYLSAEEIKALREESVKHPWYADQRCELLKTLHFGESEIKLLEKEKKSFENGCNGGESPCSGCCGECYYYMPPDEAEAAIEEWQAKIEEFEKSVKKAKEDLKALDEDKN